MDAIDGSSSAAQRAPITSSSEEAPSFWSKLLGRSDPSKLADNAPQVTLSPTQEEISPVTPHGHRQLRGLRVSDVMTPRVEIQAIDANASLGELIEVFKESELSRIPVYEGTLDTPIGMAHLKDVALRHVFVDPDRELNLRDILRPVLFVPPSMSLSVLLPKMQADRVHMALVIDEYGGVDGLVTIEDLIEEIVGEINDEHDDEEVNLWTVDKNGQYNVAATADLEEIEQEIGVSLKSVPDMNVDDIDTLGGLIFMLAGRVPSRGEVITHPVGVEFDILEADPRRVKRVRMRVTQPVRKDD